MQNTNDDLKQEQARKNKKLLTVGLLFAVGMFGFGFAMVPLYNVLCKVVGLNGKTSNVAALNESAYIDTSRTIEVIFVSQTNGDLAWDFKPLVEKITLHPGENRLVKFYAHNRAGKRMTVQAIPSVTPGYAAQYLQKTECFCFTQQTFEADQAEDMPMIFRLDSELPKEVNTVILSYTLFDATQFAKPVPKAVGHL